MLAEIASFMTPSEEDRFLSFLNAGECVLALRLLCSCIYIMNEPGTGQNHFISSKTYQIIEKTGDILMGDYLDEMAYWNITPERWLTTKEFIKNCQKLPSIS